MVTLLNTTDGTIQRADSSFWTNSAGTGILGNGMDYMSPAGASNIIPKNILLNFIYNNDTSNISAEYSNTGNTLNFYSLINLPVSNSNIDFNKVLANNMTSDTFFGNILSFQVLGNGDDQFRIWYNLTDKSTCNQTGGIGTKGDDWSWWIEAGFTSNSSCGENVYRSYLGNNRGGSHPVITDPNAEALLSPSDIYSTSLVKIFVR